MKRAVGLILAVALAAAIVPASGQARTDPSAFNEAQIAAIRQINAYLNSLSTLEGDFVQVAPDGHISQGRFYIERPGRLRFEYAPPVQMQVISDGRWVAVQDRKLKTTEKYPLMTTPLNVILSNDIDLMRDTRILAVYPESELVTISIEQTSGDAAGTLTLMFDPAAQELRRWTITDVQGLDTTVALENVVYGVAIDPKMFRIIENRILDIGGSNTR
jgi:outer membrane lipoprotein-sorting protein